MEDGQDEDGQEVSPVELLRDRIQSKASKTATHGEVISSFPNINMQFPRGRFDTFFHADSLRLSGKSYDLRVAYNNINRCFMLPKPDNESQTFRFFAIQLKRPLRQGATVYSMLVMQLEVHEEVTVAIDFANEAAREAAGGLPNSLEGTVSLLFLPPPLCLPSLTLSLKAACRSCSQLSAGPCRRARSSRRGSSTPCTRTTKACRSKRTVLSASSAN